MLNQSLSKRNLLLLLSLFLAFSPLIKSFADDQAAADKKAGSFNYSQFKMMEYHQSYPASCGPATMGSALYELGFLEKFDKKTETKIYNQVALNNMQMLDLVKKIKSRQTDFCPTKSTAGIHNFLSRVVNPFVKKDLTRIKFALPAQVAEYAAGFKGTQVTIWEGQERWPKILQSIADRADGEEANLIPATMLNAHQDSLKGLEKKGLPKNLTIERRSPTFSEIQKMLDQGQRLIYLGLFYDEDRMHYNLIRKDASGAIQVVDPGYGTNVEFTEEDLYEFLNDDVFISQLSEAYDVGVVNTGIIISIGKTE